jgi:hypothetical protein
MFKNLICSNKKMWIICMLSVSSSYWLCEAQKERKKFKFHAKTQF